MNLIKGHLDINNTCTKYKRLHLENRIENLTDIEVRTNILIFLGLGINFNC